MAQMSADQVPGIYASGQFRIASVNLDAEPLPWADGGGPAPAWSQHLASLIAQKGEIAIARGDWNHFPGTLLKADCGCQAVTSCSVI